MPGTISFDGLATGINTTDTVDKLIEVESRPKILKEAEKVRLENQLSTWQNINTNLLDLREKAQTLWKSSTWNTVSASSSDTSVLTADTTSSAKTGSYTIEVVNLAQNHQVASQSYASDISTVGTGTLDIDVGSESASITVDSTNNTLTGIADAINQADVGATASVINDGSGYRLIVVSDESGTDNAITMTPSGGVSLVFSDMQAAEDAEIKLGSGAGAITITSSSNEVEDVIEGVTLNLVSESATPVTLNLTRDAADVEEDINAFIESYNTAMGLINQQFDLDANTGEAGILMGDRTLLSIQTYIQGLVVGSVATNGTYTSLANIGIEVNDDGSLSFDSDEFSTAIDTDYESVEALFRTTGRTGHSKISYVYAGYSSVEPTSAGYDVEITQAAEQAAFTAGSSVGSLTIDSTNDSLTLELDEGGSFSISITQATYASYDDLAEEIQNKINAASPNGEEAAVSASGGVLTITSQKYGSSSQVRLVSGNGLANLGFNADDEDVGVDVEGTINGESATGSGQLLRGDDGNANTDGIQLKIELTADDLVSAGGSVTTDFHFAKGITARMNEYLQGLTMPLVGTLDVKETSLGDSIQAAQDRIDELEERLAAKRESLLEQFYRMEKAVGEFNSQSNYLINALGSLNNNWSWNS